MSPKIRRKKNHEYEYEKHKKKKKNKELTQSQKEALDKFIIKQPKISLINHNYDIVGVEISENMIPNENVIIENQTESVNMENRDDMPIKNDNVKNNSEK